MKAKNTSFDGASKISNEENEMKQKEQSLNKLQEARLDVKVE